MTFLHEAGVGRGGQGWGAARLFPQAKQGDPLLWGIAAETLRCLWPRSHLCRVSLCVHPQRAHPRDGESSSGSAGGGKAQC